MEPYSDALIQTYRPLAELMPRHWRQGFIQAADGAALHYTRTGGDKPALLLLHGVQGSGAMWLRTALAFAQQYDVVMPDFRGHGTSSRVTGPITPELLVADTLALIDALGLGPLLVMGHSMGADIAGRLAAVRAPRALVLVEPALRNIAAELRLDPDNPPPWMAAIFATMRTLPDQPHADRLAAARRLLPPGTPQWAEADYVSLVDGLAHFDLSFYRSADVMGYLLSEPELLVQISCPALLITGRPMMPGVDVEAAVASVREHIPGFEHAHLAESGHFVMNDQFEQFVATVRRFLREQGGA